MAKTMKAVTACLILALCVSCSDDNNPVAPKDIIGSGNPATETRTVAAFQSVDFRTAGEVRITSGSQQNVKITVDDNLLEYLQTKVSGGELVIAFDDAIDPENFELLVELTMTDLEALTMSGAGSITGQNTFQADVVDLNLNGAGGIDLNLQADHLKTSLSGAGTVTLAGHARKHTCTHTAVGALAAYAMDADTAVVTLSGVGNAQVSVNDHLVATITGAGSIYYKGQPQVDKTVTGLGNVHDAN